MPAIITFIFFIIGKFFKFLLIKFVSFSVVITAWYVAYSFLADFVSEKINMLFSGISVFNNPLWISFSSVLPDNLLFCINIISQAFTLYLFFRIKNFILGKFSLIVS